MGVDCRATHEAISLSSRPRSLLLGPFRQDGLACRRPAAGRSHLGKSGDARNAAPPQKHYQESWGGPPSQAAAPRRQPINGGQRRRARRDQRIQGGPAISKAGRRRHIEINSRPAGAAAHQYRASPRGRLLHGAEQDANTHSSGLLPAARQRPAFGAAHPCFRCALADWFSVLAPPRPGSSQEDVEIAPAVDVQAAGRRVAGRHGEQHSTATRAFVNSM